MTTVNALCGGVTSSTARVTAKVTGTGTIRVAVATNSDMIGPEFFGPVTTTLNVATVEIAGLASNVQHWYAIEDAGALDTTYVGTFKTHPQVGAQNSHSLIVSGCAGASPEYPGVAGTELAPDRVSNHPVFATMAQHPSGPLMTVHLGDRAYYDPGSGVHVVDASLATYRAMYDDVAAQPNQAALHKARPIAYVHDDHDFGPNDSDSTAVGRDNACLVYRERFPSYPLPAGGGAAPIYQAWQVGRVQYVLSDTRSARSPNAAVDDGAKTMLGTAQKAWLRNILETTTAE
ncbi:MAG: alkaline phosphatase D family protein, partial [Stackebrandtia sp.]